MLSLIHICAGARGLGQITARLTGQLPQPERFAAAGRIAHALAQVCHADAAAERPWVPAADDLVIEEWIVSEAP